MRISRILFLISLAVLSTHPSPALAATGQLDIWTWRNPLPTGNPLNSVTYGAGLFVGVGTNGAIVASSNGGAAWNQEVVPPDLSLSGVAYSSGLKMFVAAGVDAASNNVILTSPDGATWTPATNKGGFGSGGLLAVACGGGYIMAVGADGANWHSSDGNIWTQGPTQGTTQLNGVAYGDNEFVVVGNGGGIFTTQNGSSWTTQTSGTGADLSGIAYDGTHQFVAVGFEAVLTSPDGANWHFSLTDIGTAATYANGAFVVVNADTYYPGILTSSDGTNWNTDTIYWTFGAIAYGGGIFVGVGAGSVIATNSVNVTNSADWVGAGTSVTAMSLNAIAYGATAATGTMPGVNLFVAGGGGTFGEPAVVTSSDGYAWTADYDSSLSKMPLYNSFITGLAYGIHDNTPWFVATLNALAGVAPNVNGIIISSTNGISWTTNLFAANVLNGIAYGNGQFVAVGNGGTNVSSSDLTRWVPGTAPGGTPLPPAVNFNGAAYGSPGAIPTFVAVGAAGVIYYSTDNGMTWTASSGQPSSAGFHGVTYGSGQFVSVGVDNSGPAPVGVIYASTNGGATWNQQTSFTYTTPATTAPPQFNSVTFAYGQFVAVGAGAIFVSADGVHWSPCPVATPGPLNAVASGNDQYISVGGGGAIVGSQLPALGIGSYDISAGSFSFTVSAPPGTYGVYVSQYLTGPYAWLPPQNYTFSSSAPSQTVIDLNAGLMPTGYYYLSSPGP